MSARERETTCQEEEHVRRKERKPQERETTCQQESEEARARASRRESEQAREMPTHKRMSGNTRYIILIYNIYNIPNTTPPTHTQTPDYLVYGNVSCFLGVLKLLEDLLILEVAVCSKPKYIPMPLLCMCVRARAHE